jgi:hypothetical protein
MDPKRLAVAVVLALVTPLDALAYCRRTTCDPSLMACKRNAEGCVRDGAPLRWTQMPLVYRFDAAGSKKLPREETRAAIRAAFDRWSDVLCDGKPTSLRFVEGPEIADANPATKDAFGIYFRDADWPYAATEALGKTNIDFGVFTGTITYADIEINTAQQTFALSDADQGIDLQYVMTHEVGHWIGLAHAPPPVADAGDAGAGSESIMEAQYCSDARCGAGKFVARRLSADDVAAVCALYPPEGTHQFDDAVPPSAACDVGRGTSCSGAFAVLLALAACARRWRRG